MAKAFSQKSVQAWCANNDTTMKYFKQSNRSFRAAKDVLLSGEMCHDCQRQVYPFTNFCHFTPNYQLICNEKLLAHLLGGVGRNRYNSG